MANTTTTFEYLIREGEEKSFNEGLIKKITYPLGNTVEYSYDIGNDNRRSRANITEVKQTPDSRGGEKQTTVYTYENDTNMVKSITGPKGNTTQFEISKLTGNMDQVTYPGGKVYLYTYNTYGQSETVTDPLSKITRYSYYPENVPSGSGEGAVGGRELDTATGGYLQSIVVDEGGDNISRQFVYNRFAGMAASTDGEGGLTLYQYYANHFNEVEKIVSFR
jgi:YD repeat-containing protein